MTSFVWRVMYGSREADKDLMYFDTCLDAIKQHSKDARIFCLIHKMDLVPEDQRESLFNEKYAILKEHAQPLPISCFKTSIWDETLYEVHGLKMIW